MTADSTASSADIPYSHANRPCRTDFKGRCLAGGTIPHVDRGLAWGDGSFVKSLGTCSQFIEVVVLLCNADAGDEDRQDLATMPPSASRGSAKSQVMTMSMPTSISLALLLVYEQLCAEALLMATMTMCLHSAQDLRLSSLH